MNNFLRTSVQCGTLFMLFNANVSYCHQLIFLLGKYISVVSCVIGMKSISHNRIKKTGHHSVCTAMCPLVK